MDLLTENNIEAPGQRKVREIVPRKEVRPSVFEYVDFRLYLKDMHDYKKSINSSYSENAFIYSAGFGKNSRGYFGLIIKGKRNLTARSIIGFSNALSLNPKEALFFENLVNFNQANTEKEKIYFFERMKVASVGEKSKLVDILASQYRCINEWHLLVLREIVSLKDFTEDVDWIRKKLEGKVPREKITEGLNDLMNLGLLTRDINGKLVQSDPLVIFKDNTSNFKNSSNLHKQFIERASFSIMNDAYEKRAAQLITLAIPSSRFEDLRKEMQEMTKMMLKKYGDDSSVQNDLVVQMGIQLIQVTGK